MKRISIDFTRPHFKHWAYTHRISLASTSMYGIGIVLLVVLTSKCLELEKSANKQRVQIQELRANLQIPVARATTADAELSSAKILAQNIAIQKLNLPWRDLLETIERATPKNIALLSLEPDASKNTLVLVAESANAEAMLDYISHLKEQNLFVEVHLATHEISKQDPFAPYRFQVEAHWQDGAL